MKEELQTLLVHAVGVIAICFCLWLTHTLKDESEIVHDLLIGGACGIYGALGFKPANPVLKRILQNMNPAEVKRLTQSPPPPAAPVVTKPDGTPIDQEPKP